jgi:hypothetical protein
MAKELEKKIQKIKPQASQSVPKKTPNDLHLKTKF